MYLYLIDGYSFVFRAFHSLPPLTREDGTPIGAVYGFTNMLFKFLNNHEADFIAVVLDAGQKTFRHQIYDAYKANRPPAPEELIVQFPIIREVVEAFDITVLEKEEYEADDLIASYARAAVKQGLKVKIISSDKDLTQLIDDKISMYDAMRDKVITAKEVSEKHGVEPTKMVDFLALIGDSSDNIPGVSGIGPKTATELLNTYGSLENIYNNIENITPERRKQLLIQDKDNAMLSKQLVTLKQDLTTDYEIEALKVKQLNYEKLATFCLKQGFKSLAGKMQKNMNIEIMSEQKTILPVVINDQRELNNYINKLVREGIIALLPKENSIQLATEELLLELNLYEKTAKDLFSSIEDETQNNMLLQLKEILEDPSIKKITYDAKSLLKTLKKINIKFAAYDDIALMSYAIHTAKHGYSLVELAEAALEKKTEVTAHDLISIYKTYLHSLYKENALVIYNKIDKPLAERVADMEIKGVKIDTHHLSMLSKEYYQKLREVEEKIWLTAREEFNIGSPKQLGEVLFEKLKIPGGKKTKSGYYTTSASVLESLSEQGFEIADCLMTWRHLSKLVNTYVEVLPKAIDPSTGRVHTTFLLTSTSTGRFSSIEPNLQNIPIRTDEGTKIRQAFVAEDGNLLISADYSQIELRLLAHIANIIPLKEAFKNGHDIHAITASQMFGIPLEQVNDDLRRHAKTINFGIIYGISSFGLAKRLDITKEVAKNYIDNYFKQYHGIKEYMNVAIDYAKKHGFVKTIFGRRCYIPDINSKNFALRGFSERAAINAPLQGTAADVIRKAMVMLPADIAQYMTLQIHDELLFEVPANEAEGLAKKIKNIMERAIFVDVPIKVDVYIGANWSKSH